MFSTKVTAPDRHPGRGQAVLGTEAHKVLRITPDGASHGKLGEHSQCAQRGDAAMNNTHAMGL
ncbi:hypothetical protein GCM10010252_42850 [Streptomyces aureoverticillatus]|nr:hypothetical protein GCM10010252_42850 [Streptomyces aureoverticillatus]